MKQEESGILIVVVQGAARLGEQYWRIQETKHVVWNTGMQETEFMEYRNTEI